MTLPWPDSAVHAAYIVSTPESLGLRCARRIVGTHMYLEKAAAAAGEIHPRAAGIMLNTKDAISREPVPEGVIRMGR